MRTESLNIPVQEYTSPLDLTATEDMKVSEVYQRMQANGFRHVPVLNGKKLVGILSDRDISLVLKIDNLSEINVKDIMVADPYCAYASSSIVDVAFNMAKRKIGSALILNDDGELEGIFTSTDALNALIEITRGEIQT